MQERSASRDIDEPEVPDIGVPSIGVDGKPPKDDAMTARAARRSYVRHAAVYKAGGPPVSLLYLPAILQLSKYYREYGQFFGTLDKLRQIQSLSVNIQCNLGVSG
jgi:hypothetical protein